jgi:riboflavin transporter FmnP
MTHYRKMLVWGVLSALAALLSYLAFRAYLAPELLINFFGSIYC